MKRLFIFCLGFLPYLLPAQHPQAELDSIFNKLKRYDEINWYFMSEDTSYYDSMNHDISDAISKISEAEWPELTNHSDPFIRTYAFDHLLLSGYSKIDSIVVAHLADTALHKHMEGCFIYDEMVGDHFVMEYCRNYKESKIRYIEGWDHINYKAYIDSVIYEEHAVNKILDSLLLFYPNVLIETKKRKLLELEPEEKYHKRLREIVQNEGMTEALVALAKYKDINDTDIISSCFNIKENRCLLFKAMAIFPHQSFYRGLVGIINDNLDYHYYGDGDTFYVHNDTVRQLMDEAFPLLTALSQYDDKRGNSMIYKKICDLPLNRYTFQYKCNLLSLIYASEIKYEKKLKKKLLGQLKNAQYNCYSD